MTSQRDVCLPTERIQRAWRAFLMMPRSWVVVRDFRDAKRLILLASFPREAEWTLEVLEVGGDSKSPWVRGRSLLGNQAGKCRSTM